MASNKNVTVLAPNGRRQNVKVTPNTTILQVLEEVCKKHGYNSDDYDLKHLKKVLDTNAILRFTGLPNNAQLEMVPCTKARSKSLVTIGIQLENGERLMGEYIPDTTLAEVLKNVCPDQNFNTALLTYMHREIHGTEALKSTTLKSLGLNNGKAVLRLMHRDPQQVKTQLHVSKPLKPSEQPSTSSQNKENTERAKEPSNKNSNKILDIVTKQLPVKPEGMEVCSQSTEMTERGAKTETNKITVTAEDSAMPSTSKNYYLTQAKSSTQPSIKNELKDTIDIKFLGERNALVFNQASIQPLPKDELPDNFYDLTVDDVKVLLRDAKRRREELEEAPLLTNVQRQLNNEKRTLSHLNKYQYTIIRIQFPDQFILQGLFRPLEKVQTIKDFVKSYLSDPDGDFEIFTTPPKYILNSDAYLVDENLVPSAIVYYSGPSVLKSDIKEKSINPKDVEMQAAIIRASMVIQRNENDEDVNVGASTSQCSESTSKNKNKIAKWLKTSFK